MSSSVLNNTQSQQEERIKENGSTKEETFMNGNIFISNEPDLDLASVGQEKSLLHRYLRYLSEQHADKLIWVDVDTGREWTGKKLHDKILDVASGLKDLLEFEQGTIFLINYNHTDMANILCLAVIAAGGTVAFQYPMDPYPEVLYSAQKTQPKFLICRRRHAHWGNMLERDLGHSVKTILMGHEDHTDDNKELCESLMHMDEIFEYDRLKSKSLPILPVACKDLKNDIALILMSSGTTGKPKAIPATHYSILCDYGMKICGNDTNIRFACTQSLDYVSGRMILLGAIDYGYTAYIISSLMMPNYLKIIQDFKINLIFIGASSFYNIISHPQSNEYDLSSLSIVFPMGARVIYLDEMKKFLEKYPHIKVNQAYGSTELAIAAMITHEPEQYLKDSTNCGNLLPSCKAKIVHPETGKLLGKNEHGLVQISSPRQFPGYFINTKTSDGFNKYLADSDIFDEDGYYKTGDLGYFNDNGQLFIYGRYQELMTVMGCRKVLPQELEEWLSQHPAIDKACVIGIKSKRELNVDCPRAFVKPKDIFFTGSDEEVNKIINSIEQLEIPPEFKSAISHGQLEIKEMEFVGLKDHKLCRMNVERRRLISESIMEFMKQRVAWDKQLFGGLIILDELRVTKSTGKVDKNFLKTLSKEQVEIYGDRSY